MTLSFNARAMHGASLSRTAFVAAVALWSSNLVAQKPRAATPTTGASAAPASWDSLYHTRKLFELRDSVQLWNGVNTPTTQLYRGLVAHAFNANDVAIADLAPLIDSTPNGTTPSQLADLANALGDSYRRVFRYRESAAVYRTALMQGRPALDSATRSQFESWIMIGDALSDVSPQRVAWSAGANTTPLANDSVPFALVASVNGDTTRTVFGIDASAPLSTIDSSTAAMGGVRLLKQTVRAMIAGQPLNARIGVVSTLDIGPVTIANAVVLVLPDDSLKAAYNHARVSGVLALPILSAVGAVTFTRDGHLALSSPGADNDTTSVSNMVIDDDATVLGALYGGRPISMLLDATAPLTLLYPPFVQEFASTISGAPLTTYVGTARGGGVVSLASYVLPNLAIIIGGRPIQLGSVHALMRDGDSSSHLYTGALGQDGLRSADRVTLDFAAMTVRFRDQAETGVLPRIVYPIGTVGGTSHIASKVPEDIAFVVLLFALFVVPKALQRYRLPSAITSLLMGAGATALGLFHNDPTLHLLSTFGIVALFLFAGLEIDGHALRRQAKPLLLHGLIWSIVLAIGAGIGTTVFGFATRPAVLIALALLTPSTGFILSSLSGFGLHESERFSVKTYAIASELLALAVLFFVLQSTSVGRLALAVAAMLGVVIIIPLAFKLFARLVAPHAPRSEFAFLLMVAIVCAYATRRLGVYYLVGAFLVGIAAQRFRSELPAMSSEKMVDALESFGSVFIPFYFFHAGTDIVRDQITWRALAIGLALIVLLIPLRIVITAAQRLIAAREPLAAARRIGIALVPTLVFTLVITDILNTEFGIAKYVLGALVLYTAINTSIPAFVLHSAPPEFENVEAAAIEVEAAEIEVEAR
ncbi:MAG: cation:proton antiporter [Gemmatimonadaceae bacterium]